MTMDNVVQYIAHALETTSGRIIGLYVLIGLINIVDVAVGVTVAFKEGRFSSHELRIGVLIKIVTLLVVGVCIPILFYVPGGSIVMYGILGVFVVAELTSLLESAVKLNANLGIFNKIAKYLDVYHKQQAENNKSNLEDDINGKNEKDIKK